MPFTLYLKNDIIKYNEFEYAKSAGINNMIRSYHESDLPEIIRIANQAWRNIRKSTRATLGDNITDLINPGGDNINKGLQIKAQAESNPDNIFICEENGKVVGFITFAMNDLKIGEILNNAVDPECGLKGMGQQMYHAVLEYFRSHGMKAAKVTTGLNESHAPARRAYKRAGFDRSLSSITYYREL